MYHEKTLNITALDSAMKRSLREWFQSLEYTSLNLSATNSLYIFIQSTVFQFQAGKMEIRGSMVE